MENNKEEILKNLLKSDFIHQDEYDRQIDLLSKQLTKEDLKAILKEMTG